MEYKTKGKRAWFIDAIDTETRFMVSSEFTRTREQMELKKVISRAKENTGDQIKIVTSDGYTAYPKAIRKVFGFSNKNTQTKCYP